MKVQVTSPPSGLTLPLPQNLSAITRYDVKNAVNASNPRSFTLQLQQQAPNWLLNGRNFEMTAVAPNESVKLNSLELWEFNNLQGPDQVMETAHPMHVHGVQFQVVERVVRPDMAALYGQVNAGFTDEGWKDTVLVMPGEKLRFLVKFQDYTGLYLYHCHNLEHEDKGMMRNFRITA